MRRFLVLGNEERQKYLFQMLCAKEQTVTMCSSWLDGEYDAILLPPAQTAGYLPQFLDKLAGGEYVFGCNFPQELISQKNVKNVTFIDYMKENGTAYANAAATAEGAIAEAILAGKEVLTGKNILITGYGRCGQVLADRLLAFHAHITIYEKDTEKQAAASSFGFAILPQGASCDCWSQYDYVFNTIPALILDKERLAHIRKDAVLIDIASKPGGIDHEYCRKNNLNARLCGGLPAKYAPKSAAGLLFDVIKSYFNI